MIMAEPSRRFKPEACEKCGLVTRDVKQAQIGSRWIYACAECRGFKADDVEKRKAKRERLYSDMMR
jgi:hypothetical protein